MANIFLVSMVGIMCFSKLSLQEHLNPRLKADIYNNAPSVIQAALRNVGLGPNSGQLPTVGMQSYDARESKQHKLSLQTPLQEKASNRYGYAPIRSPAGPVGLNRPAFENIRRGEPPFVVIRPLTIPNRRMPAQKSKARIVLALPNDKIQILSADVSDTNRGSSVIPSSVTFKELGDGDHISDNKKTFEGRNFGTSTSKLRPQVLYHHSNEYHDIKDLRGRNGRKRYNFLPIDHDSHQEDSEEDLPYGNRESSRNKGHPYEEYGDLISAGGHLTLLKAQKTGMPKILKAQRASGRPVEAMKAIFIEPQNLKAKRVTYMKSDVRKVTPMKARLVKASSVSASMTKSKPVQVKSATYAKGKTHRHDRSSHVFGASNIHVIRVEPQLETGESRLLGDTGLPPQNDATVDHDNQVPPIDLQCGGNNDLGWCDLGPHYPISEVAQIVEVCEELVSRMYVDMPLTPDVLEDLQSYSMSHNITEHFNRRWDSNNWKTEEKSSKLLQGTLCNVERSIIRPSFAQDLRGKWHVIIQTDKFSQKISLEVCRKPGDPCNQIEVCNHNSQCVQKYTYQHLISFDPESAETCPFTRIYKFPTSCVCRVSSGYSQ